MKNLKNSLKSILASALLIGFLMSTTLSACNSPKKEAGDSTEETAPEGEKSKDEEHPSGEHPSNEEGEHPSGDESDSTQSEHPAGEHPSN